MAGHNQEKQNCRLCGKPQSVLELDAHLARCKASAAARYEVVMSDININVTANLNLKKILTFFYIPASENGCGGKRS